MNNIRFIPETLPVEAKRGILVAAGALGVATVARSFGIPLLTITPMTRFLEVAIAFPANYITTIIADVLLDFSRFIPLTMKVATISAQLFGLCCGNPNRATALPRFKASLAIGCAVTGISVGAFFGKALFGSYAFGGCCALLGFGIGAHEPNSLIQKVETLGIPITFILTSLTLSDFLKSIAIFRIGVVSNEIFLDILARIEN